MSGQSPSVVGRLPPRRTDKATGQVFKTWPVYLSSLAAARRFRRSQPVAPIDIDQHGEPQSPQQVAADDVAQPMVARVDARHPDQNDQGAGEHSTAVRRSRQPRDT